jgi:hypothetical protein
VYTDVEVYQDISAAAVTIGELMGVAGDGSTTLYANTLIGVYETTEAIGIVTAKQASSTSARVRIIGMVMSREILRQREDVAGATTDRPVASGGSFQGTYAQSITQNYPLGTKRTYEDGRVFRYVKARTALNTEFGCCYNAKTVTCAVAPTQATGAGTAGQFKVTMTVAAGDGLSGGGVIATNELAGGYVVIGNGASQHPQNRLILANTSTSGGGPCTLTLAEALETTVTVNTTTIETLMCPWIVSDGNATNSEYVTFKGMPACQMTINYYGWIQTQGPCWITSDTHTCDSINDRRIYFVCNGSVKSGNDITGNINQLAGHAIDASSTGASNAPFVNLCMEVLA